MVMEHVYDNPPYRVMSIVWHTYGVLAYSYDASRMLCEKVEFGMSGLLPREPANVRINCRNDCIVSAMYRDVRRLPGCQSLEGEILD